ncbi:hypothetical protein JTE90_022917 [Oedothorax gibbosus]|uniref:Uncharacterized protein n=1 Tax=Oedothorax gibbosus TaxID=931172 RepID=A0AAV6TEN7_9ARAC|nr:hypothetical protein JTE90_022917 [Oedothorax gibbosus]
MPASYPAVFLNGHAGRFPEPKLLVSGEVWLQKLQLKELDGGAPPVMGLRSIWIKRRGGPKPYQARDTARIDRLRALSDFRGVVGRPLLLRC